MSKQKYNFICPNCNKKYYFSNFTFNGVEYKERGKFLIICTNDKCKIKGNTLDKCVHLNPIEINEKMDYSTINIGKFNSLSKEDKQKHLRKRADIHAKKFHNPKDVGDNNKI